MGNDKNNNKNNKENGMNIDNVMDDGKLTKEELEQINGAGMGRPIGRGLSTLVSGSITK